MNAYRRYLCRYDTTIHLDIHRRRSTTYLSKLKGQNNNNIRTYEIKILSFLLRLELYLTTPKNTVFLLGAFDKELFGGKESLLA